MGNAEEETTTAQEQEENEDDGPPPGFMCIIAPLQPPLPAEAVAHEGLDEEEDEEGPPPGFDSIVPKPSQASPDSSQKEIIGGDADADDVDGPPPGWEIRNPLNESTQSSPNTAGISDTKTESDDDLDEGPPPGWETVLPNKMVENSCMPPQDSSSSLPSSLELERKLKIAADNDDKVSPVNSELLPTSMNSAANALQPEQGPSLEMNYGILNESPPCAAHQPSESEILPTSRSSTASSPLPELPSSNSLDDFRKKPDDEKDSDNLQQQLPPGPLSSSAEKAQLVCGTCRKLCLYPEGTKWVQCPSCKELNFVLEEHEVGQVYCGGCSIFLMYPHGAPAVQCSSCQFITEIGEHNRRPPLASQLTKLQNHRSKRPR